MAIRCGSAPTATQLRTASSIAAGGHPVGIEVAVAGIHAAGDDDAAAARQHRPQHGRVARAVVGHAHQRLDHAAALHLVVVLADDPFLAADVQRAEDRQERGGEIGTGSWGLGDRRRERWLSELAADRCAPLIDRFADDRRAAVVQELHRQVGHLLVVILQHQPAGGHELADHRGLDAFGAHRAVSSSHFSGGTARTIRSWASEIQISV